MKLPDRVRVGYRSYALHAWTMQDKERKEQWGECDTNRGEIYVCTEVEPLQKLDILLHELLHAVWSEYNLSEKPDEETAVNILSTGLTQVLYDNPELVKVCTHLLRIADK